MNAIYAPKLQPSTTSLAAKLLADVKVLDATLIHSSPSLVRLDQFSILTQLFIARHAAPRLGACGHDF